MRNLGNLNALPAAPVAPAPKRHTVWCPVRDKGGRERMVRVGHAVVAPDMSIEIHLDVAPFNGRLVVESEERRRKRARAELVEACGDRGDG